MPGHSRSKNGVASLAYLPGAPIGSARRCVDERDGWDKPGHDRVSKWNSTIHLMFRCHLRRPGPC
jgi:hypothetical protein